ncbi:MAG TPA: glycosyltransferase family 4 protein [Candidatus Limnocylindrales bacterium]|nr:glycosyltransferase family 4 protein [Candidatus Limnocylindrales bacterium]
MTSGAAVQVGERPLDSPAADAVDTPAGGASRRITLVISALGIGGAERVMAALANRWAEAGWHVTIVTFSSPGDPTFFVLDDRVTQRQLNLFAGSRNRIEGVLKNVRRVRSLRRAIAATRPDVVLAFLDRTNVLTLLATVRHPWPVVVSERSAPHAGPGRGWGLLRSLSYRRARRIVVQTSAARQALPSAIAPLIEVIPNPVLAPRETETTERPAERAAASGAPVVALGRFVRDKGFDLLIEAFAKVAATRPDARLVIWGDGPERAALEARRHELGLDEAVAMPGTTRTPEDALRRASLFVLSSRVEGFPNGLLEAMSHGVPAVAFDCRHGPAEIVRDGTDGILVPAEDVDALAAAIGLVLDDDDRRAEMGRRATEVRERFSFERIGPLWDGLIAEVLAESSRRRAPGAVASS